MNTATSSDTNVGSATTLARFNMVEQQVRTWDVLDPTILDLLHELPREGFVPEAYQGVAYADTNIPLGDGQFMLPPRIVARALQALAPKPLDRVLEVGTGSGYITACLAGLCKRVVSVEYYEDLHRDAAARLQEKGIRNVELFHGDAISGWQPEQAHDVVVVTGSVPVIPEVFLGWVNPGGRLFIVTGEAPAMEARLLTRLGVSDWSEESLFETDLPRLINSEPPPVFEF